MRVLRQKPPTRELQIKSSLLIERNWKINHRKLRIHFDSSRLRLASWYSKKTGFKYKMRIRELGYVFRLRRVIQITLYHAKKIIWLIPLPLPIFAHGNNTQRSTNKSFQIK